LNENYDFADEFVVSDFVVSDFVGMW